MARTLTAGLAAAGALLAAAPAGAAGLDPNSCFRYRDVQDTRVASDQDILYLLRDGSVWRNHLSERCPNLAFQERFSYSPVSGACDQPTTITVLGTGVTCPFGKFEAMSPPGTNKLPPREPRRDG